MKKSDKTKLKEKAWSLCSQYNRRKFANENGYVRCCTCGIMKHWKQMQAGHWLDGRNLSILFEDNGINPQCYQCNCLGGHRGLDVKKEYREFMLNTYGEEEMERIVALKSQTKKMTINEYQELIDKYTDMLVGLDMKNESI